MTENLEEKGRESIDLEKMKEIRRKFAAEIEKNLKRYQVTEEAWIEFSDGGRVNYNYSLDQLLEAVGQDSHLSPREIEDFRKVFF